MDNSRYRMEESLLHKKRLGKHTLSKRVLFGRSSTEDFAGSFYHYTSPEGLVSILRNRHIYFTDCQFLNDAQERLAINDEMDYFWKNNRENYDQDFFRLLSPIKIDTYEDASYSFPQNDLGNQLCRYFVMSSSHDSDSLSMWKYYSKNGTYSAYNIGLFTVALADEWIDCDTGVAIESGDVVYKRQEKQQRIFKIVEKIYKLWCTYKQSHELDEKVIREFKDWLAYVSIFFKNECFASEEEFRFVAIAPKAQLSQLSYDYLGWTTKMYDFRIVNGTIVPFLKIPICYWDAENSWIIDRITIGPTPHAKQMGEGVKQLVHSLDYKMVNCQLFYSNIPLRY